MKCGYYWIVNPLPSRILEDGNRIVAVEMAIRFKGTEYKVFLFNTDEGRPELIKLLLTGLPSENIPPELLPFMQAAKEHMLTTLRLSYDSSLTLADFSVWSFSEDDARPRINLQTETHMMPHFNADLTQNVFVHSFPHREQFRLFSNGLNEGIPPQYRFLSLYKLIEMQFRRRGEWNQSKLRTLASRFAPDFQQKGITADPIKTIHSWRDKCAHVRTGKKKESFGVSELNHTQLVSLMKILPIMSKMGAEVLREITNNNVVLHPVDRQKLWEDQIAHQSATSCRS